MSERTTKALAKLDELLPLVKGLPSSTNTEELVESAEALRRAVAAFHMEAIRFRMFTVERLLKGSGDARILAAFNDVRPELDSAGFPTRSHAAG